MLSFRVIILLMACLAWSNADDSKYCSLCQNHTMCVYKNQGSKCKDGDSGVTEEQKKEIVDLHNKIRREVALGKETRGLSGGQPKAADMMKIVWDNELAQVAQRWADQCDFGHDTCRNVPRWKVGQNIHWEWKSPKPAVDWKNVIDTWHSEVDKFKSEDIPKYRFDFDTGHYTQMVWHSTYAIGCGRRSYGEEQISVCNYGPAGNVIGTVMYTEGEACSKCPEKSTCEDSLCVKNNMDKESTSEPKPVRSNSKLTYTITVPVDMIRNVDPTRRKRVSKLKEDESLYELDDDVTEKLSKILSELDTVMKTVREQPNKKLAQPKKNCKKG